jgi:flagellar hook-associated protein 1 FlgK
MTNLGLNIGLQGLLTSQAALDTIANNVTNASTPGYSRQTLEIGTARSVRMRNLLMGNGVEANVVRRTVDALLQARLVAQQAGVSRLDASLQVMSQAESFFGSPENGIGQRMQDFFDGLSSLAATPGDPVLRANAVQSATQLASHFNQVSSDLGQLKQDTLSRLSAHVGEVNELASRISGLNHQIQATETAHVTANDLRDRRDEALRKLAELVDVRAVQDAGGSVRVLVAGSMLVGPTTYNTMKVFTAADGSTEVQLQGQTGALEVSGGAIGGLLQVQRSFLPDVSSQLDSLAKNWILEMNRVHSTGLGANGPFRQLVATNALVDANQSGGVSDDLLSNAGLPFDVQSGQVMINVTNASTGAVEKHVIQIDSARTTVGDLLSALNSIDHVSADVDGQGRLHVSSESGFGFDFSSRLDPNPDGIGSFGGGAASLATASSGPFALADGDTLQLSGPSGSFTVTFDASQFAQIGQATADEIAAVIDADPNAQANGIAAATVGGRLVLQTVGSGASESFTVGGGTALGALGWSASTTVNGHDVGVTVEVGGAYGGASNDSYTFEPSMDGVVGTTAGLKILVYDQNGAQVAALDVGPGYNPGDELDVVNGVKVKIGFGTLSATDNDVFQLDVTADSDTSDLLPALGLNSLFTGKDAASMSVRDDVEANPDLLASSITGAPGDGSNVLELLKLDDRAIDGLSGQTFGQRFGSLVSGVGLEISSAQGAQDTEQFLLQSLEARRDQVSGVNVDEELTNMISSQQAYQAAAQVIRVSSDLSNELMQLL